MNGASQGTMNKEWDDDNIKKVLEIASALPRKIIVALQPGSKKINPAASLSSVNHNKNLLKK